MLKSRTKLAGLVIAAVLGVAAFAQADLVIGAGIMMGKGITIVLGAAVEVVAATVKGGVTVYEQVKAKDDRYPKLKPGANCFCLYNASGKPWTLKVPKDPKFATWKGLKPAGGIMVYSVNDPRETLVKGTNLLYLGDLVADGYTPITLPPRQAFIL